jgi:orotidine-5'-phosphate decarboxylase
MSIGLEPCAAYLPAGFEDTIAGHERFLRTIIDATAGIAAAYKFNLAFFEALGTPGWDLMYRVRERLPDDVLVIADAKRGDIGTTAEHYAKALYGTLGANAATVNPLMGRDACEPFLAYEDALTFVLVLTSNPGASDFLLADSMYRRIARKVVDWNTRGNAGMVVGATRAEQVAEVRAIAGDVPFLIPGVGAQGGDLEAVARNGQWNVERAHEKNRQAGLLFHVTRGVLPGKEEAGDAERVIRRKSEEWHRRIAAALAAREVAP